MIHTALRGQEFSFETDAGVFSRGRIDNGTRLLIETLELPEEGFLLDWGCGYGPIGIVAASVSSLETWMVDVNFRAVTLARKNAALNRVPHVKILCADGMRALGKSRFDLICSNPPIRSGNEVVFRLISEARQQLNAEGSLYLVAQTKQGAQSIARQMETEFGNVKTVERGSGYRVLRSLKPRS